MSRHRYPFIALLTLVAKLESCVAEPSTGNNTAEQELGLVRSSPVVLDEPGLLQDLNGHVFNLTDAQPYTDIFSPEHYLFSDDGLVVTNKRTGESFPNPLARAEYDDGAILQINKDEHGSINFAEVRQSNGSNDTFFVKDDLSSDFTQSSHSMISFGAGDIDDGALAKYKYGEVLLPPTDKNAKRNKKRKNKDKRELLPNFVYRRGDGTSSECTFFKLVDVAVLFDADFCAKYGSFAAARNRIIAFFASASVYYEKDMCVKLRLVDVSSPDNVCQGPSPTFKNFRRFRPCGSVTPHMLHDFSLWMSTRRASSGIPSSALVHLITGYPPSSTIGCAWLGTLCWNKWSYGVEYMTFGGNNIMTQAIVFAHEIGHNLNANHYASSSGEYIMEAKISKGTDGFSTTSVNSILSFLDSSRIQCDGTLLVQTDPPAPRPVPTRRPTIPPVHPPTARPRLPTRRPTRKPTSKPTLKPSAPDPSPKCASDVSNDGASANCDESETEPKQTLCIVEGKKETFACITQKDLLGALPGSGVITIKSCNGLSVSRRFLGDKDKKNKKDTSEPDSGVERLDAFRTSSCKSSCVLVGDFVCLASNGQSSHQIIFSASGKTYEVTIPVQKDDKDSSNQCIEAKTACKD